MEGKPEGSGWRDTQGESQKWERGQQDGNWERCEHMTASEVES